MIRRYLEDLQGRIEPGHLAALRAAPEAVIGAQMLRERLVRQFHLLDNARAFGAQPMLAIPAQWHYYELAAKASVEELVRESIMSQGAFTTLRSIQDPNLKWLGNIPADVIAELRLSGENREFRRRLQGFTQQLHSVSSGDLEATTKEVMFGLNALISEHQQELQDIQRRYGPKYKNTLLLGIVTAATFLPALAPIVGPVAPLLAGAGAAASYVRDKLQERAESRKARSSLLGVLAAAASTSTRQVLTTITMGHARTHGLHLTRIRTGTAGTAQTASSAFPASTEGCCELRNAAQASATTDASSVT